MATFLSQIQSGAEDLQNLPLEELMNLKHVIEGEIESLFMEIERITEWHTKADGKGESMNNKWVRAALVKNLPKIMTQHLAIQLRQAETVDAVYNLAMIYMHDHSTGLPRGQVSAKFYLTESNDKDQEEAQKEKTEDNTERSQPHGLPDPNAVPKGGKKGKSTGYGACWHCGVWGHPRRECPE